VNNNSAIRNGNLANNPAFFGASISETIANNTDNGGWDNNRIRSVWEPSYTWFMRGGTSDISDVAGAFSTNDHTSASLEITHRTILSGY
jgi:hypothetical protein